MKRTMAAMAMAVLSTSVFASSARADEILRYDWHLRGALSWIARVKFPTSGTGILQTLFRGGKVQSQLSVDGGANNRLQYLSVMDGAAARTLSSVNEYVFGSKTDHKETVYDYASDVARVAEQGNDATKTRPLPTDDARDVLTTIHYLRANAASITAGITTDIFSDGKPYRVVIRPEGVKSTEYQGRNVPARVFSVVSAPGAQKKFPGVQVWLSEDEQRLPLRIILDQPLASLDLRLRG